VPLTVLYVFVVFVHFSTVEEELLVDQPDDPEVVDDHELFKSEFTAIKDNEVYKKKLIRRASQYKVYFLVIFISCSMLLPYACLYGITQVSVCCWFLVHLVLASRSVYVKISFE
jgi:hypothetical protein